MSTGSFDLKKALGAALVAAPIIIFVSIYAWFSKYPIAQNPSVNASLDNPFGFLISNFVYDGLINIENLLISCFFLFIIFLYYPRALRARVAFFLPLIALLSGVAAELAAVSTCVQSCSFYGMSGVVGGIIGFTFANFSISFGFLFLVRSRKVKEPFRAPLLENRFRNQAILMISFITYVFSILVFSGFFTLHSGGPTNQFPITVQIPETITSQSQPVQIGHTTGIAFGFLFFLALFSWTNHRFHFFESKTT